MIKLYTSNEMRRFEEAAISSGAVTGFQLMERAGKGAFDALLEYCPQLKAGKTLLTILCGPGNNGGDGFIMARLALEAGLKPLCYLVGEASKLKGDAYIACKQFIDAGGEVNSPDDTLFVAAKNGVVVDALFGTGLSRPLSAEVSELLQKLEQSQPKFVLAVDIPSGLSADSGKALTKPLSANLTCTFHGPKQGHFLADGPQYCRQLHTVFIGLESLEADYEPSKPATTLLQGDFARLMTKAYLPKLQGHKYDYGSALVLSGPKGRGGAARLAARAALRVGTGLVTLGTPSDAMADHNSLPDAIMLRDLDDAAALTEFVEADERISSICLGPALGVDDAAKEKVVAALQTKRAMVLDADGLSLFKDAPEDLLHHLHDKVVLTPHMGEFRRLFPDLAASSVSKIELARQAALRAGCTILLKGPDTVIADPTGKTYLHAAHYERATPWLATAGAGDVLAGLITGLLARGVHTLDAAALGAYLHVEAVRIFGAGLIADDIIDTLPEVIARYV